jgi:hypothetical protein
MIKKALNNKMKKVILTSLTIIFSIMTIISVWIFISRLEMPYNSEGKYFDLNSMVVYSEQSKMVFGVISICFIILTGVAATFAFRKQRIKKENEKGSFNK